MNLILSRPTLLIAVLEIVGKSVIGDRNDGSREWKPPVSNHPPFST